MLDRDSYIIEQVETRTMQSIANEIGVSRQRIQQILASKGVYTGKRNLNPPKPPKVKKIKYSKWRDKLDMLAESCNTIGIGETCRRLKINNTWLVAEFWKAGYIYTAAKTGPGNLCEVFKGELH